MAGHGDLRSIHARSDHPLDQNRPQIDRSGTGGDGLVERLEHLDSDFVARTTDCRTEVDVEVYQLGVESLDHHIESSLKHTESGASPPGVDGRDRASRGIHDEHRYAVRRGDGEQHAGPVCRVAVTGFTQFRIGPLVPGVLVTRAHVTAVNLLSVNHPV